jgi:hypothetical protein
MVRRLAAARSVSWRPRRHEGCPSRWSTSTPGAPSAINGPCGFARREEETALADMVRWVTTGENPVGNDLLTPSVVAAVSFAMTMRF